MQKWLSLCGLLLMLLGSVAPLRADVAIYVGYDDTTSPAAFAPDPWYGAPSSLYLGSKTAVHNAGAILIRNLGPTNVTLGPGSYVDGFSNGVKFQLWDAQIGTGVTLMPGQNAILTETAPGNFNTGDQPEITVPSQKSTSVPTLHLVLNGTLHTYRDTAQVLTTGGFDITDAYHRNKSMQWRLIGTTGIENPAGTGIYGADVVTHHFDTYRSGYNPLETNLSPSNVTQSTFGKLFSYPVDGLIFAQPLILHHISLGTLGYHNIAYVATENNSVYAFEADDNTFNQGNPIWQTNLGTPVTSAQVTCNDIYPQVGITSTPVIDRTLQTIYVVSETYENSQAVLKLHALSMLTGKEQPGSPVVLQASVPGTGDGGTTVTFQAQNLYQRPALLETNGAIYIAVSSHCDLPPFHGWLLGYDAKTLKQMAVFNVTPDGNDGGIWMSGSGPAADSAGNIFLATGNGTFDATTTNRNYGDSILKLGAQNGFSVLDYFTASNQALLANGDGDVGSGGVLLLPDNLDTTHHRKLLVETGKEGKTYLVDRDNMGHFHAGDDSQIVQYLTHALVTCYSVPAYFNGKVYYQGSTDTLKAFAFQNGLLNPDPVSHSTTAIDYPGVTPWISASGLAKPIVWTIENNNFTNAILHAFDANNLSTELYNSALNPGRDDLASYVKFTVPVAVNGKVFVPTANSLAVFGSGYWAASPTMTPGGGEYTNTVTVSLSCATPKATIYYTTDGSQPTTKSAQYTQPFTLTNCATVKSIAVASGFRTSSTATNLYTVDAGPGNGDGLYGTYFSNPNLDPSTGTYATEIDPNINFHWNGGPPIPGMASTGWSARWTGQLLPRCSGLYTFYTASAGGIRVFVNNTKIIEYWADHVSTVNAGLIFLTRGQKVTITVEYFAGANGSELQLLWSNMGTSQRVIPQTQLFSGHTLRPVILPGSGSFANSLKITITDAIPGATIYFTKDGTAPTTSSTQYTGAITVTGTTVIKAMAVANGLLPSDFVTGNFYPLNNTAVFQINSGGVSRAPFARDDLFNGGGTYEATGTVDTSFVANPAPPAVYLSERWGNFSYKLPGLNPAKSYLVRLHFAELFYSQPGQRLFNVQINGTAVLSNFDVLATAGAPYRAIIREFTAMPDQSGALTIQFQSVVGDAKISGIEVIPQ